MLTLGIPGIIATYIFLATMLLYLGLYTKWSWKIKMGGILITSLSYIILYMSFPPILGVPSNENPPEHFRIIGSHVQQSRSGSGSDGAIYLWLARVDTSLEINEEPRAFKLPYTNSLHEKIIAVKAKINNGIQQLGEFDEENNVPPEEQGDKKMSASISSKIKFYDIPETFILSKE